MLKFTKYGKKTSGLLSVASPPAASGIPGDIQGAGVVLTSFTGRGSADKEGPVSTTPPGSAHANSPPVSDSGSNNNKNEPENDLLRGNVCAKRPPRGYLSFTKVPKDELLKLDSEISQSIRISKPRIKHVRISSSSLYVGNLGLKASSRSTLESRASLDVARFQTVKVKVPVYDDGFFPKIQPLNKLMAMKQST